MAGTFFLNDGVVVKEQGYKFGINGIRFEKIITAMCKIQGFQGLYI